MKRLGLGLLAMGLGAAAAVNAVGMAQPAASARPAGQRHVVGDLALVLDPESQTLRSLSPVAVPGFDFVPANRAAQRSGDGYVHIGDLHLRLRSDRGAWQDFSSARQRRPVRALATGGDAVARADKQRITVTTGYDNDAFVDARDWLRGLIAGEEVD